MNIGITGANGFVGQSLVNFLPEQCRTDNFVALQRSIHSRRPIEMPNVTWKKGDLSSSYDCMDFINGLDVIIHLAHSHSPVDSNRDLVADNHLNSGVMVNLLEAIRRSGKKIHFIYASSGGAVYTGNRPGHVWKEADAGEPVNSYGIQKITGEMYLEMATVQGWLQATVLRIGNPYGKMLPLQRRQGLIGVAMARHSRDMEIDIFGNPDNVRDYLHLDDLNQAFLRSLNPIAQYQIYNVGSGTGHSVTQVLTIMGEISGKPCRSRFIPSPENAIFPENIILNVEKIRKAIHWQPKISLRAGMELFWNEAREKNHLF